MLESANNITINSGSSTMLPCEKWEVTHFLARQILALGTSLVIYVDSESEIFICSLSMTLSYSNLSNYSKCVGTFGLAFLF